MKRTLKEKFRIFLFDRILARYIKENLIREAPNPKTSIKESINNLIFGKETDDVDYHEDYDAFEEISDEDFAETESLNRIINQLKEPTFTEELIRLIRESGKKDSTIYKAADIDKRLFSKIMSDINYKPSKDTAIALALALRLSFDDMQDLISRAGYTVSHSSKRDLIIEFFFIKKQYRLFELNDALYRFGEKPLGRSY